MNAAELFHPSYINPLKIFNIDNAHFYINASTTYNTWVILLLLTLIACFVRYFLNHTSSVVRFLTLTGVESFMSLVEQTLGYFHYRHFSLIISLFIFIMMCNCITVIPWTTEPTQDLNTALALALIGFFYKEFQAIKANGFSGYLKEFIEPFFVMFPVNIIGHFSKIISISFRLFGNIFGGSIIMELYKSFIAYSGLLQIIGLISGLNFLILLFFGIFEGLIQAFVFSMLTLTYLSLAIHQEPVEEH